MDKDIEKILENSLQNFEGTQINVFVSEGLSFYEEDSILKNNILNFLKQDFNLGSVFYTKNSKDKSYKIEVSSKNEVKATINYVIKIIPLNCYSNWKTKKHLKGKYLKTKYTHNKMQSYIQELGIIRSQKAHAKNLDTFEFIDLRSFLRDNPSEFSKKDLFIRDINDDYVELRHKNLFSSYKDEISDFEKLTYIERVPSLMLKVGFVLDDNILNYEQDKVTLLERKNARFFAKEIYAKKDLFSDKEICKFLKDQGVYVKINVTVSSENKNVWSKIHTSDMNILVLEKEFKKFHTSKRERVKNIQKNYLSKRNKKRKMRRFKNLFIKEGLEDYYELN